MQISDDRLREFTKLYADEWGEELSLEEARIMASRLVNFYIQVARRLPSERQRES